MAELIKSKQMRMVDVYTVAGVEFLDENEAIKFQQENIMKSNQALFAVRYGPKVKDGLKDGEIVYTKKVFVSIRKRKGPVDMALIVALNSIAKKHKDLLTPHSFKKYKDDKDPVTVDGFKVERIKFNNAAEYDEATLKAYEIKGKLTSVKTYKTNEFGKIINK